MISYDKTNKCFKGNFEKDYIYPKFENPNIQFLKKKFNRERYSSSSSKRIGGNFGIYK